MGGRAGSYSERQEVRKSRGQGSAELMTLSERDISVLPGSSAWTSGVDVGKGWGRGMDPAAMCPAEGAEWPAAPHVMHSQA